MDPLGAGVVSSCEPSDVGSGNWIQILPGLYAPVTAEPSAAPSYCF